MYPNSEKMACVTNSQLPYYTARATGDARGDREARFFSALCHIQSVNRAEIKIAETFFSGKDSRSNGSCRLISRKTVF